MMPFVQKGSFLLRGGGGASQEEAEPMCLRTRPVAFKETETIKTEDTEAETDEGTRAGGTGSANLSTADSLWDGTRSLASPTVAFRVGARMPKQLDFSLTSPRLPLRRRRAEPTVQGCFGVIAQEGPEPVFRNAGRRHEPVSQGPMEIASEPQGDRNMASEGHEKGLGPVWGEEGRMGEPIDVATMFFGGSSCVGDLTGPMPLGGELYRRHIPVASNCLLPQRKGDN